jgi:Tol biopolymer transport system component
MALGEYACHDDPRAPREALVTRRKVSTPVLRTFAVLLLSVAATAALAAPAHAAFPGQNGKILFIHHTDGTENFGNGSTDVHVMNQDGTSEVNLTPNTPASLERQAVWSPDGEKIALMSWTPTAWPNDETQISVMNADGTDRHAISDPVKSVGLGSWSPDGRELVYSALVNTPPDPCGSGHFQVFKANADGSGEVQLTFDPDAHDTYAAWSPSGEQILFTRNDGIRFDPEENECSGGSPGDLFVMNADGTGVTNLTSSAGLEAEPEWSPDGQRIAFTRMSPLGSPFEVWLMDTDGTAQVKRADGSAPAWSPDGTKIAFSSPVSRDIYTAGSTSGAPVQLTDDPALEHTPDWQPILHDAPQSAGTITTSLVPAFRQTISSTQCQSRGGTPSTHGAPLSLSSCNPPGYLPNTTARLGSQGSGSIQLTAVAGNIATLADEADLAFTVNATDVRDRRTGADYDPSAGGADVTLVPRPRISDTYNSPTLHHPATVRDLDFFVPVDCAATPDPLLGATCSASTSADAVLSGAIREGERTIWQAFRLWLRDSGANDVRGDTDDRLFAQSGVYIP